MTRLTLYRVVVETDHAPVQVHVTAPSAGDASYAARCVVNGIRRTRTPSCEVYEIGPARRRDTAVCLSGTWYDETGKVQRTVKR